MHRIVTVLILAFLLIVGTIGFAPMTALAETCYKITLSVGAGGSLWMNGYNFRDSIDVKEGTSYTGENYLNLAEGTRTKRIIDDLGNSGVPVICDSQKPLSETPFDAKAQAGATRVDLSWDYMPDTKYEVTRTGGGTTVTLLADSTDTSYTDSGVVPGIEYEYTVRAHIWQGEDVAPLTVEKAVTATTDNPDVTDKFKDAGLRQAILEQLGRSSGPITLADMLSITSLSATFKYITDLSGLEYATNLEELNVWGNRVSDISPLAGLTKLKKLDLGSNVYVSDISALASLTDLEDLKLYMNDISDISPLAGLTKLKTLLLANNVNISDISALSSLNNLEYLQLGGNDISDISALSSLNNLEYLYLDYNDISDISVLPSLSKLECLYLDYKDISDISALAPLKNLTELFLSGNHISDISVLSSLTRLEHLGLGENEISDISALALLKNLKSLNLGENMIRDITPLAGLT